MFKKVYRSKEQEDFRENAFSVIEVSKKAPIISTTNLTNNHDNEDIVDAFEEQFDNYEYDDEFDSDDANDVPFFDECTDENHTFEDCIDDTAYNDDQISVDGFQSFADMDAGSIDWNNVDFANTDWSQY